MALVPVSRKRKFEEACWICMFVDELIPCSACSRVYHADCKPNGNIENCRECDAFVREERRLKIKNKPSLSKLTEVLKHVLLKMQMSEWGPRFMNCKNQGFPHPMDLEILSDSVSKGEFRYTFEFFACARYIEFNAKTQAPYDSVMIAAAENIMYLCETELQEIDRCPDCYLASISKTRDSFTDVCNVPHLLVWAKYLTYPHWPAKVYDYDEVTKKVYVRFFGEHSFAEVEPEKCYLLADKHPVRKNKITGKLNKAVQEMSKHVKKLEATFGKFNYAFTNNLVLSGEDMQSFLEQMIPNWKTKMADSKKSAANDIGDNHATAAATVGPIRRRKRKLEVYHREPMDQSHAVAVPSTHLDVAIRSSTGKELVEKHGLDVAHLLGGLIIKCCKAGRLIGFEKHEVRANSVVVTARDADSRDWLLSTVPELKLWGSPLTATLEAPQPRVAELFFPGCIQPSDIVLDVLGLMNRSLSVKKWQLLTLKYISDGLKMFFLLHDEQVEELEKIGNKPFWAMEQLTVIYKSP